MKLAKKFTAAALIAAMALIAGCGGGADKKAATPSGAKVTLKMAAHLPASHPLVKAMNDLIRPQKNPVALLISRFILQASCLTIKV